MENQNNIQQIVFCDDMYYFQCPHCFVEIQIHKNDLNCKIFRCGIYKSTNQPIPPHASKEVCDKLFIDNLIYGCGKPFFFKDTCVEICDYI